MLCDGAESRDAVNALKRGDAIGLTRRSRPEETQARTIRQAAMLALEVNAIPDLDATTTRRRVRPDPRIVNVTVGFLHSDARRRK
jgi:hypothetical protein